jgi:hypothetical protein
MKKLFSQENLPYAIVAIVVLFVMCFVLFYFSETQFPTTFKSAGIVAIISAIIGVALTAFAVSIQLKQQSDTDAQRKKNVKIFEQKIHVYSRFTKKLWEMFDDAKVTDEELKELRKICFKTLVFYLNSKQIEEIANEINRIEIGCIDDDNPTMEAAAQITHILRRSLDDNNKGEQRSQRGGELRTLFNSFNKQEIVEQEELEQVVTTTPSTSQEQQQVKGDVSYWHFSMLYVDQQIKAFEQWNKSGEVWVLALLEYGEVWRTNLVKAVKPGDVIFLLKRGGSGYIGAFKAMDPPNKILEPYKILEGGDSAIKDYNKDREKYDIYEGLNDGASLCSNILVKPIAYNCKGVKYDKVIPKTIERMKMDSVMYLLDRFNGKKLDENRLAGKGRFDDGTPVTLDESYFSEIIRKHNLQ